MLTHTARRLPLGLRPLRLLGCKAPPRTLAQTRATDQADSDLWHARGDASLRSPGRLALAETSVQFVTSKFETGDDRQAAFIPPHPVFLAASAAGVGRKDIAFDDNALDRIAAEINRALESELAARGWRLVHTPDILAADAYARFDTLPPHQVHHVRPVNHAAPHPRRVRPKRVHPAGAAGVITGPSGRREAQARQALLNELGADALLRVIIRVGVYQGRASFEEGSRLLLTTPNAQTDLTARHSLLSDRSVLTDEATDGDFIVSEQAYLDATRNTAPLFLSRALDALQPTRP
ncbi:MAG: hypothetical protein ACIARR_10960 [Phycisphaerales bacterium JB059]